MEETYSDDEGVVVLKRRSVKLTLIDSDDDDDDGKALGIPSARTDLLSGGDVGDSSSGSSEEDDDDENSAAVRANRSSKKRLVVARDSSESDSSETPNKQPTRPALVFKDKDLYDDETSDHDDDDADAKMAVVKVARKYAVAMREEGIEEKRRTTAVDEDEDGDFRPAEEGDSTKPSKKLQSRKAKTAAMEGIELIHSETQRLLRESRLSLPYHRPKQHSITEFLQRKSLRSVANTADSQQDLTLIWKELEERTKEAEAFYKSDSDTEEEEGEQSRDPVVSDDALKDSGILSAAASFDGEASSSSSPVDGDGRDPTTTKAAPPCEATAAPGTSDDDLLNTTAAASAETSDGVVVTPGEVVQAEETVDVGGRPQLHRSSPEAVSSQQQVEETSPDLFPSQSQQSVLLLQGKDIFSKDRDHHLEEAPSRTTTGSGAAHLLLLSKLGDVKPRLSCGEGDLVDLTVTGGGHDDSAATTPRSGVEKLISRFIKHTTPTPTAAPAQEAASHVPVSVVSVEKDESGAVKQVKADTVYVPAEECVVQDPRLARPGAKLQRLKQELNREMARQRELEWARRQREFKMDEEEEEIDEDKSVCGGLLDDEREAELSSSEPETEEEEDDVPLVEKKRTKSAFVDDEAEVSQDEDEEEEDSAAAGGDEDEDDDGTAQDTEEDEEEEGEGGETPPRRPEDSGNKTKLRRIKTFDMFDTDEEKSQDEGEEDVGNVSVVSTLNIPPYQPGGASTQPPRQQEPGSITPLLKVPLLRGVISSSHAINLNESSLLSPCEATQPLDVDVGVNQAKKKLFNNQSELSGSSNNMADLMDVCSGTSFSGKMPSELLGLCSGQFLTQPLNMESLEKDDDVEEDTQPLLLQLPGDDVRPTSTTASSSLLGPTLRYQDSENANFPDQTQHTPPRLRLTIDSSSDEETEAGQQGDKKKMDKKITKKNLKLYFSDEEEVVDEDRRTVVGYDSEENEIDVQDGAGAGARGFFEAEAELSESEWGSEDEDERDLDKLEWEEGDADNLNEKKVRQQLEKIHMRRVLDEDQREVRILQELLLEDGEFHSDGPGRERKFRWRNINVAQMQERDPQDSDNGEGEEEGEEEQDEVEWRRKRLERETFLMEQKEKAAQAGRDFEEDLGAEEDADSQLLQLGKAALRRMRSFNSDHQAAAAAAAAKDPQQSPNHKYPFRLLSKRGSFLSRSEGALARIAHMTRGAGGDTVATGPRHSRNFVFATLSPDKVAPTTEDTGGTNLRHHDDDVKPAAAAAAAAKRRKTSSAGGGPGAASLLKKPRLSSGMGLLDHLEQLTTPS